MDRQTVEQLESIGGKHWEKPGYDRVYFNGLEDRLGLECTYYNTGNISTAKLDGERISNSEARRIKAMCYQGKVWYDMMTGEWHTRGIRDDYAQMVLGQIQGLLDG